MVGSAIAGASIQNNSDRPLFCFTLSRSHSSLDIPGLSTFADTFVCFVIPLQNARALDSTNYGVRRCNRSHTDSQ